MKKILSVLISAALIYASVIPVFASEEINVSDKVMTSGDIAEMITETLGAVSVQYAVMDNGEIIESGNSGVYSKSENRLLTNTNMYGIGSISKMYTAAAAMKLVDMGKLDIDEPVVKYMPEFKMSDERYKKITARMLMNHSSGIHGTTYTDAFLFGDNDTYAHDNFLENLAEQDLKAEPGAFSVYCNDGFTLLELLVEKISGQSFSEFLNEYFFEPLELTNTKTPQDMFDKSLLAKTYMPFSTEATPTDSVGVIGAGGIYSTAEEVCKFGEILTGEVPEILSYESAEKMMQTEYKNGIWVNDDSGSSLAYGLGWDSVNLYPFSQKDIKALTKGGDTLLYHGSVVVLPEYNITAAVLSSGGSSSVNEIFAKRLIEDRLKDKGIIDEDLAEFKIEVPQKQDMPADLEKYSGLYGAVGNTVEVIVKDGEIIIPGNEENKVPDQKFIYTGDGKFKSPDGSISVYFEENDEKTYIVLEMIAGIDKVGASRMVYYDSMKIEKNPLSDGLREAWQARDGKKYFVLTEKATSQLLILQPIFKMNIDLENGYVLGCKIDDENNAYNILQIPGMNGRDTYNVKYTDENGKEIVSIRDQKYLSEDNVPEIYDDGDAVCTIQEDRYTRWFKIPETAAGKKLLVKQQGSMGVNVYNKDGSCVDSSVVTGNNDIELPEGGYISFSGNAGDIFNVLVHE